MKLLVDEVDSDLPRIILENEAVRKHVAAHQLELALRVVLLAQQRHEIGAAVVGLRLEVRLRLFDFGRWQEGKELKSTCSHLLVEWNGGLEIDRRRRAVRRADTTQGPARWRQLSPDSDGRRRKLRQ